MRTTTTRGVLWEVLAPIVRWPMYSPVRLGLVALGVVGVLVVAGQLSPGGDSDAQPPIAPPVSSSTSTESPSEASTTLDAPEETPAPDARADVRRTARRFVRVYIDADQHRRSWLADLRALSTPELARQLRTVDQANLDLGRRPEHVTLKGLGSTAAAVVVETDRAQIAIDLAYSGSVWQVTRVTPREPDDTTA